MPGGKQQVCGRAGTWTRVPCHNPQVLLHPQTSRSLPTTGLLNPLDSPHHMRQDEESEFREGVVVDRPTRPGQGSFVNCGMKKVGLEGGLGHPSQTHPGYGGQAGAGDWGALDQASPPADPPVMQIWAREVPKMGLLIDKARSKFTVF